MNEPGAYFEEILYPLQNGVLSSVADSGAPFYLTGGTALHRHYFGIRYSDDLDFFVNRDPDFRAHLNRALASLREAGYRLAPDAGRDTRDYVRVVIRASGADVLIDFVNDTAVRFGELQAGGLYPRIDSLRNMLTNKITALGRLEAKDFVDLWTLCRNLDFRWDDALSEAREKDLGTAAEVVADLFRSFPPRLFDTVRWRRKPDREAFLAELDVIGWDALKGRRNSLAP